MRWALLLGLVVVGIPVDEVSAYAMAYSSNNINWCPQAVQAAGSRAESRVLKAYPMCCFHPSIRRNKKFMRFCQKISGGYFGGSGSGSGSGSLSTCARNIAGPDSLMKFPTCCSDENIYKKYQTTCDQMDLDYCPNVVDKHASDLCTLKFRYPSCCRHHDSVKASELYARFCQQHFPDVAKQWPDEVKNLYTTTTTTTTLRPRPRPPSSTHLSYQLNFCPRYVTSSSKLRKYPQCCFHPDVRRRYERTRTCRQFGLLRRRKRSDTQVSCNANEHQVFRLTETAGRKRRKRQTEENDGPPPLSPDDLLKMLEDSDETITVTCCGSNVEHTCTGASCMDICKDGQGNDPVTTIDMIDNEDEAACNPELNGEAGARRKKRWAGATMASWRLNWCVNKVTANNWDTVDRGKMVIKRKRICCLHPNCRKLKPSTYGITLAKDDAARRDKDGKAKKAIDVCRDMNFPV